MYVVVFDVIVNYFYIVVGIVWFYLFVVGDVVVGINFCGNCLKNWVYNFLRRFVVFRYEIGVFKCIFFIV